MDRRELFRNLCIAAYADGVLEEAEKSMLRKLASGLGIDPLEVAQILGELQRSPTMAATLPHDLMARHQTFAMIVRIVVSDGEVSDEELRLCERYGELIGFSKPEVHGYIRASLPPEA